MVSRMGIVCTCKCRTRMGRMGEVSKMIKVTGGSKEDKMICHSVIDWCFHKKIIKRNVDIHVRICKYKTFRCYGTCVDTDTKDLYKITVADDQSIRDFVATLIHELIHVNQYVTGKWKGDGEKECERRQYPLTDKCWKEGVI